MSAEISPLKRSRNDFFRQFSGREIWALADQSLISATNFITNVMLVRFMGLREFGVFALAWMSVLFVNSLQSAMIIAPMMSVSPKQEEKDRSFYFGAVFFQEVVLVSFCFILVFSTLKISSIYFPHAALQRLALPLAASASIYQLQDFLRRYFFALRRSHYALVDDALSYLTQLPILYLLHRIGNLSSATALWAMAATSALGIVLGWFWVEPLRLNRAWINAISQRHWKISRWLGASSILQWTSSNLFIIAAPIFYGAAAAGVLRASQNLMGVTHVWFQGLDNVVPMETSRRLHEGGVHSMLAYIRSILLRWGGLTMIYACIIAAAPGFWLRLFYGPEMVQYGYILQLYALLYVIVFLGGPLRAGLQALEFTAPIFWSYLAMTAFAFAFAVPAVKWLGISGSLFGLFGAQILFQSIVGVSLLLKSSDMARRAALSSQSPAAE